MNKNITNQIETLKSLRFGTELEIVGITTRAACEAIVSVVGGAHGGFSDTVTMADGREWKVVRDGSLHDASGLTCEVVSPILTWTDMDALQNIARALRAAGARVNSSCGMHVHVDGAAFKAAPKKLANLMAFASRWEDVVFQAAAPQRNLEWCAKLGEGRAPIAVEGFKKVRTLAKAKAAWYGNYSDGGHYNSTRYHWLNVHALFDKGTIEFRIFDGTLHAGKIKANVILALGIASMALCRRSISWGGSKPEHMNVRVMLTQNKLCLVGDEFETVRGHLLGRFTAGRRAEVA
jgi:hypothetical protein